MMGLDRPSFCRYCTGCYSQETLLYNREMVTCQLFGAAAECLAICLDHDVFRASLLALQLGGFPIRTSLGRGGAVFVGAGGRV